MKAYILQAKRGITASKSRTFLTTLGIMIGIGTVILVLGAGEGFKSYINAQIETLGANTLTIETVVPSSTKARSEGEQGANTASNAVPVETLKTKDMEDIKAIPNVKNAYGAVVGQQIATYGGTSKQAFLFGADAARFEIDKSVVEKGRPFSDEENKSLAQVAVLGYDIVVDFFGENDPIGRMVRVGNYNLEVVGVYERKGGLSATDDQQIYMPLTTLQKKYLGVDYLFYGIVELINPNLADATALDVEDVLRRNHGISDPAKDDFRVRTQEQNMETFEVILGAITYLLIGIAFISLIVGGVGVMNIMYVVVTERIGEIGLKKALGATNKDILYEFLIEAVILTLLGGIIGIIGGSLLTFVVAKVASSFGFAWDFIVPISGILISLTVSMLIGIIFGVFPARNAAKLDPIAALNKE